MSQSVNLVAPNGVSIDNIKYGERGLITLRSYLGTGAVYNLFKHRFDLADVAFLIAGAHKDGNHALNPDSFHPDWFDAREVSSDDKATKDQVRNELKRKLLELLFDAATMLDRITGSSTLVATNSPTVIPGQSRTLENVKVHVYVPPHVFVESMNVERALGEIVQKYVEALGLPSVLRWQRAFLKAGFSLPPIMKAQSFRRGVLPFMPHPRPGTAHYICYGRPLGEIEGMLEQVPHSSNRDRPGSTRDTALSSPHHEHDAEDVGDVDEAALADPWSSSEDATYLRLRLNESEQLVSQQKEEIKALKEKLVAAQRQVSELSAQLNSGHVTARTAQRSGTSQHHAPPAKPVTPAKASARAPVLSPTSSRRMAPDTTAPASPRHRGGSSGPDPFVPTSPHKSARSQEDSVARSLSAHPSHSSLSSTISSVSTQLSAMSFSELSSPSRPTMPKSSSPRKAAATARATPRGLKAHSIVGQETEAVVQEYGLREPGIHRELRRMINEEPLERWARTIEDMWGYEEEVVAALVDAMLLDVDGE